MSDGESFGRVLIVTGSSADARGWLGKVPAEGEPAPVVGLSSRLAVAGPVV